MTGFTSLAELRDACLHLPQAHPDVAERVATREATLTKPPGSLGRLEELVGWLALWQGRHPPRLERVDILVFAGNHGVTAQGVSAYPAEVTAQMVANFGRRRRHQPVGPDREREPARHRARARSPTADFTKAPAMDEAAFLAAVATGADAVSPDATFVCLGEMGIGNTTAAAAIAAALFGGGGRAGPAAAPASIMPASPASRPSSTARSPATPRCSTIR